MVQILPAAQRKPSLGQRFSHAVGTGLEMGSQMLQDKERSAIMHQAGKEILGMDISGFDPDTQKALLVEGLKQRGKSSQQQNLMNFVNQTQSGKQSGQQQEGSQSFTDQILTSKNPRTQPPFKSPEQNAESPKEPSMNNKYSDKAIVAASAMPGGAATAREMRAYNDSLDRSTEAQEKKRQHQSKEVTESFNENKDYINKIQDQYEDSKRKEAVFDRMDQLEQSGELSDSGVVNLLETLGLDSEWLKNPANEEYNKLALDLLGGGTLQADYGSRVLASEFKVSQQRIPSLKQTPEGRKQIKENLKTMLLPAQLKQERMQYYLDKAERTGEPLPHNLRGKVLKDIKPQLEEAYDKFKQRNGRYQVKPGTQPDDNAIDKYYFLSNGDENKARKMMEEDNYDIE